eukprot:539888-Rhodomonas_salina.3
MLFSVGSSEAEEGGFLRGTVVRFWRKQRRGSAEDAAPPECAGYTSRLVCNVQVQERETW